MAKIDNDKYYTPIEVANHCWEKIIEKVGDNNITNVIEPSIGDGAFTHYKIEVDIGYDIASEYKGKVEVHNEDFIKAEIEYKKGRLVIGNPPYGRCLSLAQKFYKKSIEIADYIGFILPISQLNNTNSMYEFDLIYSEDLGVQHYTDRDLHCCFNIYVRPKSGELNKKPISRLKDITIYRQDRAGYEEKEYDIRMCYWGDGSAGKILKDGEHYSGEYKIKINNEEKKEEIKRVLEEFDWKSYLNCIAMRKIQQFHIIDILVKNVKGIK